MEKNARANGFFSPINTICRSFTPIFQIPNDPTHTPLPHTDKDTNIIMLHQKKVVKRDGSRVDVSFDEILERIRGLARKAGIEDSIDCVGFATKIILGLYDGISTHELDELAAREALFYQVSEPAYLKLAGYLTVSNHQKLNRRSVVDTFHMLYHYSLTPPEFSFHVTDRYPRLFDEADNTTTKADIFRVVKIRARDNVRTAAWDFVRVDQHTDEQERTTLRIRCPFPFDSQDIHDSELSDERLALVTLLVRLLLPDRSTEAHSKAPEDRLPDFVDIQGEQQDGVVTLDANGVVTLMHTWRVKERYSQTFDSSLLSERLYRLAIRHRTAIEAALRPDNDFRYGYFAFVTLLRSYLLKIDGVVVETPQTMLMRVALGIHLEHYAPRPSTVAWWSLMLEEAEGRRQGKWIKPDADVRPDVSYAEHLVHGWPLHSDSSYLREAMTTYELLSDQYCIHGTPTLFNSGTPKSQCSSCFLLSPPRDGDSIEGIFELLKRTACIIKTAGGIGIHIHEIRSSGAYIRGTNGNSNGTGPMLVVYNDTSLYVDQGGNKRPGAIAIYMEPWHGDIETFLRCRLPTKEGPKARDLFYAMWINDLFMERVARDEMWSLMDERDCPGLSSTWGEEFERLYLQYEREGRYRRQIQARHLWIQILQAQVETGNPYMLYKDSANRKSNQMNLGTIKSSNLCSEIIQYSSPSEVAVCNLASICLPQFVSYITGDWDPSSYRIPPFVHTLADGRRLMFDFDLLARVMRQTVFNANAVIDVNCYPVIEARRSNMRHRPIGIGVQGLADVIHLFELNFDGDVLADRLNREIFEVLYFAAVEATCDLAELWGPYSSWRGSPCSRGLMQFDLWRQEMENRRLKFPTLIEQGDDELTSLRLSLPWATLKERSIKVGWRNSQLTTVMPTATTAQINENNESIEPYTNNLFFTKTVAGENFRLNKHLVETLRKLNLWNAQMYERIKAERGDIQSIEEIPLEVRRRFRLFEQIPQKALIDLASRRGPFIDQSQSLNVSFGSQCTGQKLNDLHFYGWARGLKTGTYYVHTKPAVNAIQFGATATSSTTEKTKKTTKQIAADDGPVCKRNDPNCANCSG